jgi:hypothetical protein
MTYHTVQELMDAKDNGELPATFRITLDNDSVDGYAGEDKLFDSDPHDLLRELLDYVGLRYEEA